VLDNVNKHLPCLQVKGQDIDSELFESVLWSKIPQDVLLQLQLSFGVNNKWSVSKLVDMLNEYVIARERAEIKSSFERPKNSQFKGDNRQRPFSVSFAKGDSQTRNNSVPAFVVKPETKKSVLLLGPKKTCRYCQQSHLKNCCYKYLKARHQTDECISTRKCVVIFKHTIVCV